MVKHLPSQCEGLSSKPSTVKKNYIIKKLASLLLNIMNYDPQKFSSSFRNSMLREISQAVL
jgi:hypothetical protein